MGNDLGDFAIGSNVQLLVEYEDLNGIAITPGSPQYQILKLVESSGSYNEVVAKSNLIELVIGTFTEVYRDSTTDGIGQYIITYTGSINNIGYDDIDTFRVIGSTILRSGGDGGISGTEIEIMKKMSNLANEGDVGSLKKELNKIGEAIGRMSENYLTQDDLGSLSDVFTESLDDINNSHMKEITANKKTVKDLQKNIKTVDTNLKKSLSLFKDLDVSFSDKIKTIKTDVVSKQKQDFIVTNKNIQNMKEELKNNLENIKSRTDVGLQNIVGDLKNIKEFSSSFGDINNNIDNLKTTLDDNINNISKDIESLDKFETIKENIDETREVIDTNIKNINKKIDTVLYEKFSEQENKSNINVENLRKDINDNVKKSFVDLYKELTTFQEKTRMYFLEQQQKDLKMKRLVSDGINNVYSHLNNYQDKLENSIVKINKRVDDGNIELKEKMLFKFKGMKKEVNQLQEDIEDYITNVTEENKNKVLSKIVIFEKKLQDFDLNQQVSKLLKCVIII